MRAERAVRKSQNPDPLKAEGAAPRNIGGAIWMRHPSAERRERMSRYGSGEFDGEECGEFVEAVGGAD
jgi:hypothetical protein